MRPFGSSFIYAGWDKQYGYQVYQSDPSGNYAGWRATCIGNNSSTAQSILKTDYNEDVDLDLEGAKLLTFKILSKTIENTALVPEKRNPKIIQNFIVEVAVIRRKDDKTILNYITENEMISLIEKINPDSKISKITSRHMETD